MKKSIEKKIKDSLADVEQQYAKLQADINKINKQGEALHQLLNQKLQEAMKLKGQYKALKDLLPNKKNYQQNKK